jgi:septal ring factor EnvC (AmiA/AmiB activator)
MNLMAGDKSQLDRIEDMLRQAIHITLSTNAALGSTNMAVATLQQEVAELRSSVTELQQGQAELRAELSETKDTVYRIEHRLQVMERKQDRTTVRLDTLEVELELIKEEAKH